MGRQWSLALGLCVLATAGCGRIGFGRGDADSSVPVIDDPPERLLWSRTFATAGIDTVTGLGFVGDTDDVIVSGSFNGTTDFGMGPVTANSNETSWNIFHARYTMGGAPVWVRTVGRYFRHQHTAVDSDGSALLTGQQVLTGSWGAGFTTTAGTSGALYAARFDRDGTPAWAKLVNADALNQEGFGIASTANGVIIGARTQGSFMHGSATLSGVFIAELDVATWQARWVNQIAPGTAQLVVRRFAVLADGRIAFAGATSTVSFSDSLDIGTGPVGPSSAPWGFVGLLEGDGRGAWAHGVLGPSANRISALIADDSGGLYVGGSMSDGADFAGHALAATGADQGFLARMTADGKVSWLRAVASSGDADVRSVVLDRSGTLYATGSFSGELSLAAVHTSAGGRDVWVAAFDPDGTARWSIRFGGTHDEYAMHLAVSRSGKLCVSGQFDTSFDAGSGPIVGDVPLDVFVACFGP